MCCVLIVEKMLEVLLLGKLLEVMPWEKVPDLLLGGETPEGVTLAEKFEVTLCEEMVGGMPLEVMLWGLLQELLQVLDQGLQQSEAYLPHNDLFKHHH